MNDLRLIYDFSGQSPRIGAIILPLLFVAIGLVIFFLNRRKVNKSATSSFGIGKSTFGMFFGILFFTLAVLISALVIPSQIGEYLKTKSIYTAKKYKTVEGLVQNYHPMPSSGHDTERFVVDGVPFEFSDFDLTDYGYKNAASKGGVIKEGLYVRIGYIQ
jgi:hypothetical protein